MSFLAKIQIMFLHVGVAGLALAVALILIALGASKLRAQLSGRKIRLLAINALIYAAISFVVGWHVFADLEYLAGRTLWQDFTIAGIAQTAIVLMAISAAYAITTTQDRREDYDYVAFRALIAGFYLVIIGFFVLGPVPIF